MKKAFQIKEENDKSNSIIQHEERESMRLNKYISSSGFCSRREADRLIESGKVKIDGVIANLGECVFPNQVVCVENQTIQPKQEFVYLALHKPVGIICTTDREIPNNISSFMDYSENIFPIGRLDKDSSGLILLTNDGDIVNKILRSVNGHEKEYIVSVDKKINKEFVEQLSNGIKIYNPVNNSYQVTKKAKVFKEGDKTFRIVLTEGLNRQIRRMCTALNYHVLSLQRVRVMNIELGTLSTGQWRYLTTNELETLNKKIKIREV